ncbi:LacI family DNA-binding transcriptional regulator [Ketogulonicigenium vulgare]|uniref:LacI family DNA-binding transcriptional regulator n=1 Tax=Ketogulonicigenium vulgare TaxID=92945 RepID=UPI002359A76D|nr:LacI family DNA-binding transcriptional regulator [Ketogulonicigenium vulgare]
MSPKRPTLEDIAKIAGVSRATVSLVVRGSPLVAEATRARVEQIMAQQDYVRDIGAARLRNNSSNTVGVIVPNLVNAFFTEFLSGVEQVMGTHDRVVLLANSKDSVARQTEILQRFRGHGVDGVILCAAEGTTPDLPERIRGWGMPVVQALREVGTDVSDYAGADYSEGVCIAMRHLVAMGHRRIAFLSVRARTSAREDRLRGFARGLTETGAENAGIVEADLAWTGAAAAADAVLALDTKPTAILCFNDVLAAGLMLGLRRAGVSPGKDLAVVGLDDLPLAEMTYPPLTSIAVSPATIGAGAARLLARRLAQPDAPFERFINTPLLVIRQSVRALTV